MSIAIGQAGVNQAEDCGFTWHFRVERNNWCRHLLSDSHFVVANFIKYICGGFLPKILFPVLWTIDILIMPLVSLCVACYVQFSYCCCCSATNIICEKGGSSLKLTGIFYSKPFRTFIFWESICVKLTVKICFNEFCMTYVSDSRSNAFLS